MGFRIGIDVGGTKIEGVLMDAAYTIVKRQRVETPQGDYPATLQTIVQLIRTLQQALPQPATVGIGTPGVASSRSGLMKNCNSTCLNHQPLQADLEQLLGYPIRIANDANCFVLSESVDGAAAGAATVFGVILGTGVGGGVVVNQTLLSGRNQLAGEWGHNRMPGLGREFEDESRPCYCGRVNCIETYLSGPGLSRTYQHLTGRSLSAKQLLANRADDEAAHSALQRYQHQLAYALAQIINVLDPDVIVLGGGMSNVASLYTEVPALWLPYVFSDTVETLLRPARHGDSSGVRGAAWLW